MPSAFTLWAEVVCIAEQPTPRPRLAAALPARDHRIEEARREIAAADHDGEDRKRE